MTAAEAVFAADSAAACAQRAHLIDRNADDPAAADQSALTAASLVDLTAAFTGDHASGAAWLIEHLTTNPHLVSSGAGYDRAVFDQALRLADPSRQAVRDLRGGEQIAATWQTRRTAVAAYRDALVAGGSAPDGVLASLLHLHCLRTQGIDPIMERVCHRLARAAGLNQAVRQTASTQAATSPATTSWAPATSDEREQADLRHAVTAKAGA